MKVRLTSVLLLAIITSSPATALERANAPAGPAVGQPAPAFNLPTIDGNRITLAELRGKTVVVNVWATWCPPCRQETPDLIAAYKQLAVKNVVFVGVDSTESAAVVQAFVAAKRIAWSEAIDADQTFARAYDVRYFPTTYIIDSQGILRMTYIDVITPKLLAGFVADAKAGKNGTVVSRLQARIDGLLAPSQYHFGGSKTRVLASVQRARRTIAQVDKMVDDSDPAAGNPIDVPRTQVEENDLRHRALTALGPLATTVEQKVSLELLEGDAEAYAGRNAEALAAYKAALSLEPKNVAALAAMSISAYQLKAYDTMIRADDALVALDPSNVANLVQLGVESGKAGEFARARQAFERALKAASRKANAFGATSRDVRLLAWTHLYYGRMEAAVGNIPAAKAQFALATQTALRLPKSDSRYAIYLEQAQEETVALDLKDALRKGVALSLAPWTGPDLPGSTPGTAKYRLVVAGPPGHSVDLRASEVPKGWIASFCTDRFCAPFRLTTSLPTSGVKVIEFQLVPPEAKALRHLPRVRVTASDGRSTTSIRTIAVH